MPPLKWSHVARYRRALLAFHRVRTKSDALRFVNALGFCYAFTAGAGHLPGLFDVLTTRSVDRMWSQAWQWKDELATERRLFFGRVLKRKPTFVSLRYMPYFFSLTGNVGEADDAEQSYREGRLSLLAKEMYEFIRAQGPCSTWTLRKHFLVNSDRPTTFHRAIFMLQERCLIARVAEQDGGSFAYIWDTFHRWLPQTVRAAGSISAQDAATQLLGRYVRNVGAVGIRGAADLFEWHPTIFTQAVRSLPRSISISHIDGEEVLVHRACLKRP